MDAMVNIGGKVDEQSVVAVANALEQIFKAAYEYRAGAEATLEAVKMLNRLAMVTDTTISNNQFYGGDYHAPSERDSN